MITKELLDPKSIVIVGASNDVTKPGGKVLKNIIDHGFSGKLFVVNPREKNVQGVECFSVCEDIPQVDLAIIAVSAQYVEANIRVLALQKGCKAFILFSAGFSEIGVVGIALEKRCVEIINSVGGSLIGPNCIGVITEKYKGVFAGPIPKFDPMGCDCVSASGATMVFILEAAIPRGLKFRNIFSIGNSAQIGVEDILEYWDTEFDPATSSRIKLLYMEQVSNPQRFLKHARSLVKKGCRIAAIKSGSTDAGSRAVSSHTGSLAGSNTAVSSLFRKAGVVRCYSRVELVYVAAIFAHKQLRGDRIAVITHAGGPGVMLTDVLIKGGLKVPKIEGEKADELLKKLYPGSSVSNPIDFLATGTAVHLGHILDAVDNDFDDIDGSVVVFGTTGMWSVDDVYEVLHEKMKTSKKPIFPILPSVIQAADEVSHFHSMGHVNFTDEVSFGYVLSRVYKTPKPYDETELISVDKKQIRQIIESSNDGYLSPHKVAQLLDAVGIKRVQEQTVSNIDAAVKCAESLGFPLVMKVVGPIHKTDVGGVKLNINSVEEVKNTFTELMKIKDAIAVLIQQQKSGIEIFIGAKYEDKFGHQLLCGLGGIFIEVFKDISSALAPVGRDEAIAMIKHLVSYPIIQGVRGREGVNEEMLIETIMKLSALLAVAPEIKELDINPLLGSKNDLVAVDARVMIEK
jgi:acetate---CoA ligase (ADP-forming)